MTRKPDDTPLHSAVRAGNLEMVLEIINGSEDAELKDLLSKQNQSGQTALYVASEYGNADLVKEMIKFHDVGLASITARNGYDAFHIAAKQGDMAVLKVLMGVAPELLITFDSSNRTALHTAALQGHVDVVNFLLEKGSSVVLIGMNNGKTALHAAARNEHLEIVKALLRKEPGIATRIDKKGQTALHKAVKRENVEVVNELVSLDPSLINMVDAKGNTALHIATRKGRTQIVLELLNHSGVNKQAVNKFEETALDTAEKTGHKEIATILRKHGIQCAKLIKPQPRNTDRELQQTVRDIKYDVHNQFQHSRQTTKRVQDMAKRLNKRHREGLNNAINSTTIVAVLIATVAFAAIFNVPAQYVDNPKAINPGFSLGEARIAPKPEFLIFFISDSLALFISLALVVVQTSVVVIESEAKKEMMAIINKLMWLACVLISIAFLALSYVVLGENGKWLAIILTIVGTGIMVSTLGTLCYWVIMDRKASKFQSIQRLSRSSRSRSASVSVLFMSDTEIMNSEKLYAV
ncbi:hypothetical protein SLEP1_g17721 [Rubroshorea leprosula]|uniref:PGG domain-containing protein n=1 Tax=Rubroshorea leprosula TaxID=152421 RepID=A0AAV5J0R6_9ROSI|nr:hypothetical protein SLEP1_g17721 [Rubroshorea leprosula]